VDLTGEPLKAESSRSILRCVERSDAPDIPGAFAHRAHTVVTPERFAHRAAGLDVIPPENAKNIHELQNTGL
jgi:hypothetical protein